MSSEERAKAEPCAGSLNGCLVAGDAEENARERKTKRRAIGISVVLQSAGLAALVIAPLFAKPAELTERHAVPIPPYSYHPAVRAATQPANSRGRVPPCLFCRSRIFTPIVPTTGKNNPPGPDENKGLEIRLTGPENPPGPLNIFDKRSQPIPPSEVVPAKNRVHVAQIDPALQTVRVEPIYPALAHQLRKSGKVELRAVIAVDGTVQSLEVISGEPLFVNSALQAVRQWRYKPTNLNGKPVEIDTFITVIYTLQ